MPLTGPIPEGRILLLPALRSPLFSDAVATSQERQQYRQMCGLLEIMDTRDSTDAPIFKLIHRPEDA